MVIVSGNQGARVFSTKVMAFHSHAFSTRSFDEC